MPFVAARPFGAPASVFASEAYRESPQTPSETEKRTATSAALLATTLVALSIFHIVHSREVRMYTLGSLLAVYSSWLLLNGPADYSMSIGIPDQWDDPRINQADRYIIETALKMGVAPRIELTDSNNAEEYIEMGVKHFCIGWDVGIIGNWAKQHGAALADKLAK